MADFKTHLATSTALGAAYGAYGYYHGAPFETCVLAGGLCGVAGMLPDLDSESGSPVREMSAFAAAVVPMLMLERFQMLGWSREMIVCAAAVIYVVIRFALPAVFKRYTVHRGMWHSIPACIVCGMIAFMLMGGQDLAIRLFKSGGVVLGFLSHLVLDELWSFRLRSGRLNVKRSFGTALKLFSNDRMGTLSVYAKLLVCSVLSIGDPMLMQRLGYEQKFGDQTAQQFIGKALEMAGIQRPQPADNPLQR